MLTVFTPENPHITILIVIITDLQQSSKLNQELKKK